MASYLTTNQSMRGSADNPQAAEYSLITNNPVFKVKVRSLDNKYEQKAKTSTKNNTKNTLKNKFKIGDIIIGSSLDDGKIYSGEITSFKENNEGEISSINIITSNSKTKIRLDASTCKKKTLTKKNNTKEVNVYGENFMENNFLTLEQFILKKITNI